MKHILFVCTGNTCRSAMAAAICNALIAEKKLDAIADSCGLFASCGDSACATAVLALQELYHIDLSGHKTKPVSPQLVQQADIIFVMTAQHAALLLSQYPDCAFKLQVAKPEIIDPYGSPLSAYKACAGALYSSIEQLLSQEGLQ